MNLSPKNEALPGANRCYVLASSYTFEQLADIYNRTRVDYIVPMPMNSKRLADYVHLYDVDLGLSTVAVDAEFSPIGLIMIGIRGDHAWITRLGVLPEQRRYHVGQDLMEISIDKLRDYGVRQVQLEVITGNDPAHRLFLKMGFVESRTLLVIRRPPKPLTSDALPTGAAVSTLDAHAITHCLQRRETHIAWTEETMSLLNTQALRGIAVSLPSGENGWLIYQFAPFELTHVVVNPGTSLDMISALICQLHKQHPMHDTKIENLPRDNPGWQEFQKMGYLEVFSRIEMYKELSPSV